MFLKTLAHALVVVPVTEFWAPIETFEIFQAFSVLGVAGSTAVKQIQTQELALVFWSLPEYDC